MVALPNRSNLTPEEKEKLHNTGAVAEDLASFPMCARAVLGCTGGLNNDEVAKRLRIT